MCAVCPLRVCLTVGRCHHHTPRHLHKLHYPAVSGNRKYRAKQETEQMSTAQIDHILKANEYSHAFPRGPASHGAQGFHSNLLSANQPCEDSRSNASCLVDRQRSVGGGALLFGVFDGHAGAACAKAVSHRLFYYIATATLPLKTLQEIESAVEEARPVPPLLEFHQQPREEQRCGAQQPLMFSSRLRMFWQDLLQEAQEDTTALLDTEGPNVSSALEEAFMRLDNDLSMEAQLDLATSSPRRVPSPGDSHSLSSPLRVALSGSTACVAHLSQGVLHVANLGDSRALLGVQESDGRWSALPLTQDHTAHNPDELHRILGEHPRSERRTVVRHDRLLGMLMPLRAFGDVRFKWSKETLGRMYESSRPEVVAAAMNMALRRTMTQHYHTPPYLTAHPEVATHRLRPQDKFLIMATDGLWDLMHRHTAVQLVGEHLTGLRWQRPLSPNPGTTLGSLQSLLLERKGRGLSTVADLNSATHLLRHALGNDGYGGVEPRRLAKMLRLSPDLARMYRDDITITVVHLNEPDML